MFAPSVHPLFLILSIAIAKLIRHLLYEVGLFFFFCIDNPLPRMVSSLLACVITPVLYFKEGSYIIPTYMTHLYSIFFLTRLSYRSSLFFHQSQILGLLSITLKHPNPSFTI
jgi:hypothetical protein